MSNVTYFIGAGASANKIPCLANFTDKLYSALDFYGAEKNNIITQVKRLKNPHIETIIENDFDSILEILKNVLEDANNFSTVDTYAKYLYITKNYERIGYLGLLISLGLLFFQKSGIDKRYDGFWASILDDSYSPPSNIQILSWNYDLQFEQSFLKFCKQESIQFSQSLLNVFPAKSNSYISDYNKKQQFALVKLNGGIIRYNQNEQNFESLVDNCNSFYESIVALLIQYTSWKPQARVKRLIQIGYAWDVVRRDPDNRTIDTAKHVSRLTDTIVIIGYSFPFFNRKIDREIFSSLRGLKKIYVQDLHPDIIISRLKSIIPEEKLRALELIKINDTEQFYIPYEL